MTLVEIVVALGIFSFVVIGLVYTHLYGLSQDQLVQSKLGASDQVLADRQRKSFRLRADSEWGGPNRQRLDDLSDDRYECVRDVLL
jgi:hypothetical protein